ncbi:hypothetical protein BD560DRAFT_441433 [Blakeslea trispora]|nr:hypothetical protein BD560DRAFT_441433 [Blakeslea trispora]
MSDYKEPVYYMTEDVQRIVDELNRQSEEERKKKEEKEQAAKPPASLHGSDLCLATGCLLPPPQARSPTRLHRAPLCRRSLLHIHAKEKRTPVVEKNLPFKSALGDCSLTSSKTNTQRLISAKTARIKTAKAIKSTVMSPSRSLSPSLPTTTTTGPSGTEKISLLDSVSINSSSSGVAINTTQKKHITTSPKLNNDSNQKMARLTASSGIAVTSPAVHVQRPTATTKPAAVTKPAVTTSSATTSVAAEKAKALVSMNVEAMTNQSDKKKTAVKEAYVPKTTSCATNASRLPSYSEDMWRNKKKSRKRKSKQTKKVNAREATKAHADYPAHHNNKKRDDFDLLLSSYHKSQKRKAENELHMPVKRQHLSDKHANDNSSRKHNYNNINRNTNNTNNTNSGKKRQLEDVVRAIVPPSTRRLLLFHA